MNNERDIKRKWLWIMLAIGFALSFYWVRELIACLVIFATVFAVLTPIALLAYVVQKVWMRVVRRFA